LYVLSWKRGADENSNPQLSGRKIAMHKTIDGSTVQPTRLSFSGATIKQFDRQSKVGAINPRPVLKVSSKKLAPKQPLTAHVAPGQKRILSEKGASSEGGDQKRPKKENLQNERFPVFSDAEDMNIHQIADELADLLEEEASDTLESEQLEQHIEQPIKPLDLHTSTLAPSLAAPGAVQRRQTVMLDGVDRMSIGISRKSVLTAAPERKSVLALDDSSKTLSLTNTADLLEAKGSLNQKMKQEQSLGKWLTHVLEESNTHCEAGSAVAASQTHLPALRALTQRQGIRASNSTCI